MSGDGKTFLVRSGSSMYWVKWTANAWFQMNSTSFTLAGGSGSAPCFISLAPDGTWAYVGNPNNGLTAQLSIARPQPNNSWAITGGVDVSFPYSSSVFRPSGGFVMEMTPDGRFGVMGAPMCDFVDGSSTETLSDFGCTTLLDLRPPATIVMQPTGQAVGVGGTASFTFAVNSEVTPQFQWRRGGVNIADGPSGNGSSYSGTQSATLMVSNVQSGDQFAIYDCVVTNACSNLVSSPAVLSVQSGGSGSVCVADLGQAGGIPGHDGALDNNDFIAFINAFFNHTGCP
ncbi:MAG: immunoglobulin domain-containing protein [Phycisphaerales bacterium]